MITAFLIKWWELIVIGFLIADIIVQKTPWKGDDDILAMIKNGIKFIFSTKPGVLPIFLAFMLIPSLAFADPHLTADPQTNVTYYVIQGDINATVSALDIGDGTVKLWFDLEGLEDGRLYNIQIKAKNVWGESVAVPFVFTKAVADALSGIRIE